MSISVFLKSQLEKMQVGHGYDSSHSNVIRQVMSLYEQDKLMTAEQPDDCPEGWFISLKYMSGIAQAEFVKMINTIKGGGQVDVVARCDGKEYRWECDGLKYADFIPSMQNMCAYEVQQRQIEGERAVMEALKPCMTICLPTGGVAAPTEKQLRSAAIKAIAAMPMREVVAPVGWSIAPDNIASEQEWRDGFNGEHYTYDTGKHTMFIDGLEKDELEALRVFLTSGANIPPLTNPTDIEDGKA